MLSRQSFIPTETFSIIMAFAILKIPLTSYDTPCGFNAEMLILITFICYSVTWHLPFIPITEVKTGGSIIEPCGAVTALTLTIKSYTIRIRRFTLYL